MSHSTCPALPCLPLARPGPASLLPALNAVPCRCYSISVHVLISAHLTYSFTGHSVLTIPMVLQLVKQPWGRLIQACSYSVALQYVSKVVCTAVLNSNWDMFPQ